MTRLFKLINISGRDSVEFLQGQLTQDLQRLDASSGILPAAWCNPQGRVIGTMRLIAQKDSLELVVPATLAEAMVERFLLYRFRADVDFRIEGDDWRAFAVSDAQDFESLARLELLPEAKQNAACRGRGLVAVETGARPRTVEIYGPAAAFRDTELSLPGALSDDAWQRALITAGVPLIGADASEKYTPHMLNLDRLGAVSFDKGCYTGQEIVARTEYRGKSRRRLMHYRTEIPAASIGNRLADGEREAGDVVNVVGTDLLAVVPRDLHAKTLAVDGVPATPVPLPYDL